MVYAPPNICLGELHTQNPQGFSHTNGSPYLNQRPDLIIINKMKRTCKIVDFAVPADHRPKLKECEKKDKYLNLRR